MWSVEKANEWYREKGWVVGFNYVTSSAVNSTEMWQSESYEIDCIHRELALAAEAGFNSCRVFLQFLVWDAERDGFLKTFDSFLAAANMNGISVMPILFDDCAFSNKEPYLGKQQAPVPGIHNSGWTPSPGFTISDNPDCLGTLEKYVKSVVNAFSTDKRILAWDIYNEPGNSNRGAKSLPLLRDSFKWARDCALEQPLTAGVWEWKEWDIECIGLSDIISYHDYMPIQASKERAETLVKYNRPMFCTEWLHRLGNNTVKSHLQFYKDAKISIYNWGLVNGKTQTYLSWNADENPKDGMPEVWQHDFYYGDLTPYDPDEIALLKKATSC